MKVSHLKVLDGVRALAALMVMVFHFFQYIKIDNSFYDAVRLISAFGRTGVTLFFVLSGFLITRILLVTKRQEGYFKWFYLRRAVRIFPLYYFFLLVFYFVIPWIMDQPFTPANQQWPHYLYLQNFADTFHWPSYGPGHFWSLAVEENFYFVWPLLVYMMNEKALGRFVSVLVAISLAIRLALIYRGLGGQFFIVSSFDALAMGALLALKESRSGISKNAGKGYLVMLVLLAVPTILLWFVLGKHNAKAVHVFDFPIVTALYLSFVGLLVSQQKNQVINLVFCSKPLLYLGKISYGLYVYHTLCFDLYFQYFHFSDTVINILVTFTAAIIMASLSYYLLELPFLKLKNKMKG